MDDVVVGLGVVVVVGVIIVVVVVVVGGTDTFSNPVVLELSEEESSSPKGLIVELESKSGKGGSVVGLCVVVGAWVGFVVGSVVSSLESTVVVVTIT